MRKEMTELWIHRFHDYPANGESVTAWCKSQQVNLKQFYSRMRKLGRLHGALGHLLQGNEIVFASFVSPR